VFEDDGTTVSGVQHQQQHEDEANMKLPAVRRLRDDCCDRGVKRGRGCEKLPVHFKDDNQMEKATLTEWSVDPEGMFSETVEV